MANRYNTGLSVHMNQVHKETVSQVENALPNRQGLDVEIFGMEGVPQDILDQHRTRIIQNFYQAQESRRLATGNPLPGQSLNHARKKIRFETAEELLRRLAEWRAHKKAGTLPPPAEPVLQQNVRPVTHACPSLCTTLAFVLYLLMTWNRHTTTASPSATPQATTLTSSSAPPRPARTRPASPSAKGKRTARGRGSCTTTPRSAPRSACRSCRGTPTSPPWPCRGGPRCAAERDGYGRRDMYTRHMLKEDENGMGAKKKYKKLETSLQNVTTQPRGQREMSFLVAFVSWNWSFGDLYERPLWCTHIFRQTIMAMFTNLHSTSRTRHHESQ